MKPIKTVGIIGLGALGVLYAQLLTKAIGRERVLILADAERTARYRESGMWYNGEACDFQYVDAAKQTEPVDLLLFAVLFLMYRESGDKELLIIMGGMFLF
jgi:2-dehydropantoate 2-reductase